MVVAVRGVTIAVGGVGIVVGVIVVDGGMNSEGGFVCNGSFEGVDFPV